MIPCLYDIPRLAELPDGEDRWMLQTRLIRERNRVIDGLDEARVLIADARTLMDART